MYTLCTSENRAKKRNSASLHRLTNKAEMDSHPYIEIQTGLSIHPIAMMDGWPRHLTSVISTRFFFPWV